MQRRKPSLFAAVWERENARARPSVLVGLSQRQRLTSVDVSMHLELAAAHTGPITSLCLDYVDSRYLLSASADATIGLYDAEDRPGDVNTGSSSCEPLAVIPKEHPHVHKGPVSAVQWFPHDTGLFASSGHDGLVKLWDTNEMAVACDFVLPGRVHAIAMSAVATNHGLIATGAEGTSSIHLCDAATGSAAQVLVGHRAPVWALSWSPRCEYTLASGGADRSVRLWDIRRAGACLKALDQHETRDERKRLVEGAAPLSSSSHAGSTSTTVAGAARALATTSAHNGPVSSICYCADGLMLLTAGRDHRMRLWDSHTGANTLVHYPGAFNTARGHKQLGVTAAGGHANSARVYFPGNDGLHVYDLLSGRKLQTLKAHLGEVVCCTAAPGEPRLFTGGVDSTIHVWTPPARGLFKPAPAEKPHVDTPAPMATTTTARSRGERYLNQLAGYYNAMGGTETHASGSASQAAAAAAPSIRGAVDSGASSSDGNRAGRQTVGGEPQGSAPSEGASTSTSAPRPVAEDGDAWSDEDEDETTRARAAAARRNNRGAQKRRRLGS
jgi:DNA excision repair protein ERCC-8